MKNTLFILGTMDPEMAKIKKIIELLGYNYVEDGENLPCSEISVFIECSPVCNFENCMNNHILIDHHNPEDYGYHYDYNNFLAASSLGQFFRYILTYDFDNVVEKLSLNVDNTEENNNEYFYYEDKWFLNINSKKVEVPKKIVYISGIDHCLKDVYAGKCLGIKHEGLFEKRLFHIGQNLNIEYSKVLEKTLHFLDKYFHDNLECEDILDLRFIGFDETNYPLEYLILREISLYLNKPIMLKLKKGSFSKIMFLSVEKDFVLSLLENKKYNDMKFIEVFGVPNRNYVGGIY